MKNRLPLLLALVCLAIAGCASTDVIMLDTAASYPPTENVVLLTEESTQPHAVIAIIEGNGTQFNNQAEVIRAIQKRAQRIGAHAIMLIDASSRYVPTTTHRNVDGTPLVIQGGDRHTVKAAAIRFTGE